jgi:hypothetical protein
MKKSISFLALVVFIAGILIISCQSSGEKVEEARKNVKEAKNDVLTAKQELDQALNDSIQQFKIESAEKINSNEKKIADFRAKMTNEKMESKARYEKLLAGLEQKNTEMKKSLLNSTRIVRKSGPNLNWNLTTTWKN